MSNDLQSIKDLATEEWRQAHRSSSFTTLPMIKFLLDIRQTTFSEFVRRPQSSLDGFSHKEILHAVWTELQSSPENRLTISGRCTVMPIQVMRQVDLKLPGRTNFQLYDVGNHRLARCTMT
jgi:hypothetical protein